MKILIATDDLTERLLLHLIVRRLGHRPTTATDGAELIDGSRYEPPDVILLDLQSPVMGGSEAIRAVLDGRAHGSKPVIVGLTTAIRPHVRQSPLERSMDDFLLKPLDAAALRAFLERGMSSHAGHLSAAGRDADPTPAWVSSVARRLQALGLLEDPRDAADLIADYLFATDQNVEALSDPRNAYNRPALVNAAHDLAVLNSVVGLDELSARCQELEVRVEAGERLISAEIRGSVANDYHRFRPQLLRYQTSLRSGIGGGPTPTCHPSMRKGTP